MVLYDRTKHLKQLHTSRKEATRKKVDAAILRLLKSKSLINFNSVVKESGVSKATLYNNCNYRKTIEEFRNEQSQVSTPAQIKREMSEQSKDAIIASLKRRIKMLADENANLKTQLKINYANYYSKR